MENFHAASPRCSLTIGVFDGVHLGHQAILSSLQAIRVAVTFVNHPQVVLSKAPPLLLITVQHRLNLLRNYVDQVHTLSFTESLSKLQAKDFLTSLHQEIPFTDLLLGHDAVIGYQREGTPKRLQEICGEMGITLTYLPPVKLGGEIVSSSRIRAALTAGHLDQVKELLGRPYSIQGIVSPGSGHGQKMGIPTANVPVEGLVLPPKGVYAVEVAGKKAIANLGHAPTFHAHRPVLLEVHFPEPTEVLYHQEMEVVFKRFIRPEQKFSSIEALKEQIHKDILYLS